MKSGGASVPASRLATFPLKTFARWEDEKLSRFLTKRSRNLASVARRPPDLQVFTPMQLIALTPFNHSRREGNFDDWMP